MTEGLIPGVRYASRAQELWAFVIASAAQWQARAEAAAAAAGLSPVAAWALVQLDPTQPLPQKELAARLHCNPSSVVDTTDRLEQARLVVRSPSPEDRRVKVLVVTRKGARVRQLLITQMLEPPESFARLPAADQTRLRDLMHAAVTGVAAKSAPLATAGRSRRAVRHSKRRARSTREI
ncbi:MAG TPA: MarR family transcriptional regulator [Candidatus Dormibacteraeota bacterium]|nr:MarR family transcriptional regulator [Candidatus Dormibacteraeota bacterium]